MTEKQSKNDRNVEQKQKRAWKLLVLPLIYAVAGVFGWFYVPDVLLARIASFVLVFGFPMLGFAYYYYLPWIGTKLISSGLSGLASVFLGAQTQSKMAELSAKGVQARQQKALDEGALQLVTGLDPLKGIAAELLAGGIGGMESLGPLKLTKTMKTSLATYAQTAVMASQINFTEAALNALDTKFPQLKLRENLKILGVLTTAEKIR